MLLALCYVKHAFNTFEVMDTRTVVLSHSERGFQFRTRYFVTFCVQKWNDYVTPMITYYTETFI